jgi:hypothetical protein
LDNKDGSNYSDTSEIRKLEIEVLEKKLGGLGTAYFLSQFNVGKGDYTKEKDQRPELTREEARKLIV